MSNLCLTNQRPHLQLVSIMASFDGPDDPDDNSFVVERLLSEGWIVDRHGRETFMYLIKWRDIACKSTDDCS